MTKKVILTILDGFGYSKEQDGNAVYWAKTPNIDRLLEEYPHVLIGASGHHVGLPDGQMGNSEVGHLNIGAGRVVHQKVTRIDKDIETGDFRENEVLTKLMAGIGNDRTLHLMGLLSNGGVHSEVTHLDELLKMAADYRPQNVYVHCFTDGRDTSPHSGIFFLKELEESMYLAGTGKIATVIGRYYAMDRDHRWERIESAYNAMVKGEGLRFASAMDAIKASYSSSITDEFVKPSVIAGDGKEPVTIKKGDAVVFFNFRADRGRQLTRALTEPGFDGFERELLEVEMVTLTVYDEGLSHVEAAYKPHTMNNILGEVVSKAGMKQLRIAETEKYPHVTFFFNGGAELEFPGEKRILMPSPKVATYDLQPEMSALEVTNKVVEALNSQEFEMIILNLANCDMVGHTGIFEAAVKAVETVDDCTGKVYKAAMNNDYTMFLTADHGNSEMMIDFGREPFTSHTTNPVHFIYIDRNEKPKLREDGALCNIAPTILKVLGLEVPEEMEDPMTIE